MLNWSSYVEPSRIGHAAVIHLAPFRNGTYAGDGTHQVLASVPVADLPNTVPDALRGHVAPVRDRQGRRVDYQLVHSIVDDAVTPQVVEVFRRWRSTWMYSAELGDLAQLRTLRRWLPALQRRTRIPLDNMARINWQADSIDPDTAFTLLDHLGEVRRLLADTGKTGWVLYDVAKNTRVRAGVCLDHQETLLASTSRCVITNSDGQLLLHYDGPFANTHHGGPKPSIRLDGWVRTADTTTLHGSGTTWTADPATKALLADLAPTAPTLRITSVPAAEVFEPTTARLVAAFLRAAHNGTTVQITTTPA